MKGEKAMPELEKLLDKIYRHADAQGTAQAQILSAFAEKDKRIAKLEAQVEKMKKAIYIRDRIMNNCKMRRVAVAKNQLAD
jgi:regulator of protease activity HflC (stomatin/prohibitin superfamily)